MAVPERGEPESEVERLAGEINGAIGFVGGLLGCLFRVCVYLVLGFLALEVILTVVGGTYNVLAGSIGAIPALLVIALGVWVIVRVCRRSAGRRQ
jgi:hypothetical protein